VRDWTALVRDRLTGLDLDADREDRIRAEIAAHLEDCYGEARRCGNTDGEAVARTLALVTDWQVLARSLRHAERGDGMMSADAKTILLPGLTATAGAALVFGVIPMLPSTLWVTPPVSMHVLVSALLFAPYVACGALGAWWSRRAGGTLSHRLVAGFFPLLLNLTMVVAAIVLSGLTEQRTHPTTFAPNMQLGVLIVFVLVPGMALAMGALPFLKEPSRGAVAVPLIPEKR
jgi:hypothetical protein